MKHTAAWLRRLAARASESLTVRVQVRKPVSMVIDEAAERIGLSLPDWHDTGDSIADNRVHYVTSLSRKDAFLLVAELWELPARTAPVAWRDEAKLILMEALKLR